LGQLEHAHGRSAPERLVRDIRQLGNDALPGDRIAHEHHATLEPGDAHATVGYVGNLQLDELTRCIVHLTSIAHQTRPTRPPPKIRKQKPCAYTSPPLRRRVSQPCARRASSPWSCRR